MASRTHEEVLGTRFGRDWHRRRGEVVCDPCRLAWNAVTRERIASARERGWVRPGRDTPRSAQCAACGELLTGYIRSDSPMHNACRLPKNWANAIQVSRRERLAIYERDGWTCQLCAEPVDPSLDPLHRMAATLDHIIPRALTLFPDDSPANLRLAHRSCNSARGIRAA